MCVLILSVRSIYIKSIILYNISLCNSPVGGVVYSIYDVAKLLYMQLLLQLRCR